MFHLFSKKKYSLVESGILKGATDIHCHLLPGVDDGSPDAEHSLELLSYLEELGYEELWLTPHTMEDLGNTPDKLTKVYQAFLPKYQGNLKLHLASEYMMDYTFEGDLAQDKVLPIGKKLDHLLVETSYRYGPQNLEDILISVFRKGLIPIIAHPERYEYMDKRDYEELKEKGYHLQLNLNSLSEYYGPRAHKIALDLLKNQYYDYVGTDLHHLAYYEPALSSIRLEKEQLDELAKLFENNKNL